MSSSLRPYILKKFLVYIFSVAKAHLPVLINPFISSFFRVTHNQSYFHILKNFNSKIEIVIVENMIRQLIIADNVS